MAIGNRNRVSDVYMHPPPSRLSIATTASSTTGERQRIKKLLEDGLGSKIKQTSQMMLMVAIPIGALLTVTTITLVSTLDTATAAITAQHQLELTLQVSVHSVFKF